MALQALLLRVVAAAAIVLAGYSTTLAHPDGTHSPGPGFQVGSEFSGQWYNPEQPGHGLLLEVLPGGMAFGAWFVFDDDGNPFWVVGTGRMDAQSMTLDVRSYTGGRFPPNFDPAAVQSSDWGTLTIRFDDCSSATLEWNSRLPGFGNGSMPMARLTSIDQLPCGEQAEWQADLVAMTEQVIGGHPNPFHQLPRASFEARLAALRQRLPGIPAEQVPVAFAELLAGLGDAHTAIFLQGAGMRRFPLEFTRVREGLIVTAAHDGYEDLLGHRLVAIDGTAVETIQSSLERIISHENRWWVEALAPEYMVIPEVLAYLGHTGGMDRAAFRFQALGGGIVRREVDSMPPDAPFAWHGIFNRPEFTAPMYMSRQDSYWYEYMPDSRTMYLAYHQARQMHGMPFDDMLHRMEMFIGRHPVDRLIVDLRLNRGGDSSIIQSMIQGLTNSPYNNADQLFVLIGRNTFSSGLMNALELRDRTNATFVGGPTGGKPDHFGETRTFHLEHMGVTVTHSTRYFSPLGNDSMGTLHPDIRVGDPTWREFLEGRDPCIRAVVGD